MSGLWAFARPIVTDIVVTIFVVEGLLRRQEDRRTREARRAAATMVAGTTMELLVLSAQLFELSTAVGTIRVPGRLVHSTSLASRWLPAVTSRLRRVARVKLEPPVYERRSTVPSLADLQRATDVHGDLEILRHELDRLSQDLSFAIGGTIGLLEPPLFRATIDLRLAIGELCVAGGATHSEAQVVLERLARERARAARRFAAALGRTVEALRAEGVETDGPLR